MSNTWIFSNIPAAQHARVIRLFEQKDYAGLLEVHDLYRVSSNSYECCGGKIREEGLYNWFKYGIDNGFIATKLNAGNGKGTKALGV